MTDIYTFNEIEVDVDYIDAMEMLDDEYESIDNAEEIYGGYGSHFDCYSTFDADDYEYCQGGY